MGRSWGGRGLGLSARAQAAEGGARARRSSLPPGRRHRGGAVCLLAAVAVVGYGLYVLVS